MYAIITRHPGTGIHAYVRAELDHDGSWRTQDAKLARTWKSRVGPASWLRAHPEAAAVSTVVSLEGEQHISELPIRTASVLALAWLPDDDYHAAIQNTARQMVAKGHGHWRYSSSDRSGCIWQHIVCGDLVEARVVKPQI